MDRAKPSVAIVDYGLGNLYSIKQACKFVGLDATITNSKAEIFEADAVILPGVGAFKVAMDRLHRLDLVNVLKDFSKFPKLLFGISLGFQLLMTESFEFGFHKGLGIINGQVVKLNHSNEKKIILKVPQVGWNRIFRPNNHPVW